MDWLNIITCEQAAGFVYPVCISLSFCLSVCLSLYVFCAIGTPGEVYRDSRESSKGIYGTGTALDGEGSYSHIAESSLYGLHIECDSFGGSFIHLVDTTLNANAKYDL